MKKIIILGLGINLLSMSVFAQDYIYKGMDNVKAKIGINKNEIINESCKTILDSGHSIGDGIYEINVSGSKKSVYCDMSGGGWTLIDNFVANSTVPDNYGAAYGLSKIYNIDLLQQAGYETYLTKYNYSGYYNSANYLQLYYGSSPRGYIEKVLPNFGNEVKVLLGNWYSGSAYVYLNEELKLSISSHSGEKTYIGNFNYGDKLKIEEHGIFWINSLWVR